MGRRNGRAHTFMRPASWLRYGSILILETAKPAVFSSKPQLEAIMPFPTPEMTPEEKRLLTGRGQEIRRRDKKPTSGN